MPQFTSIVFDLDGTVIDSLPGIEFSAHAAIAEVCPDRVLLPLRGFIGPPVREVFRRALAIEEGAILDALVAAFRRSYDRVGWEQTLLFEHVESTLRTLANRGMRLFVLTNKPIAATDRILRYFGIRELLECVAAPSADGLDYRDKVDAARALQASAKLPRATTLLIGDSRDDALAAVACGFEFAAVRFGYGDAAAQSVAPVSFRLDRFHDVFPIVQIQP